MNSIATRLTVACISIILIALIFTPQVDAQNGLVAAYLMEEGDGETVVDSSGNGHDGTFQALVAEVPLWVDGWKGGGLWFDGIGALLNVGPLPVEGDPMTVMAYVQAEWDLGTPRNVFSGNNGFAMPIGDEPSALDFGKGGVDHVGSDDLIADDGEWHHVAVVYDDGDEVHFFIDGVADSGNPKTYTTKFDPGVTYWVGGTDKYNKFLGSIDEAALFNVGLSEAEIKNIADNGLEDALGLTGATAVSPEDRLTTTWGQIKSE